MPESSLTHKFLCSIQKKMKVTDKGSSMWQMAVLRETRRVACKLIMASFGNYHALELITGSPLLQLPVSSSMKRPRQRSTLIGYDDRPSTPEPGEGKRSRHRPSLEPGERKESTLSTVGAQVFWSSHDCRGVGCKSNATDHSAIADQGKRYREWLVLLRAIFFSVYSMHAKHFCLVHSLTITKL